MRRSLALVLVAWTASAGPPAEITWNEQGLERLLAGKPEEAARAFEEALVARSAEPVIERNLAAALAQWGEERRAARHASEALLLLEQAVRLHPTRLSYRVLLGRARFEAGDDRLRAAARDDFGYVLARDPDHVDALVNLGQIEYLARELEAAAGRFRHALDLRPGDPDIAERLARALRELEVERSFAEVSGAWFLVRYSPAIPLERAQAVLVMCEEARGRLSATYGSYPPRIVVTLYTPGEFKNATLLHGWVSGLSDGTIRLTLPKRPDDAALRATIVHEMTHHIVREVAPGAPVWLHEGLAQIEEGRSAAQAEERLRQAGALPDTLLSAEILRQEDPRKVVLFYDAALAFTRYLDDGQRGGIARLLRGIGAGKDEEEAFSEAFGDTREKMFERWRNGLK
jgi:hypothetical protein